MSRFPNVSVVMSVFNKQKFVQESVESVLNQTYKDFELIIVNDGSTDGSLDILMDYVKRDKRIVLVSQDNRGAALASNTGLALARGEFVARLDSDDIWMPHKLERQVIYMESHPDVSILGTHAVTFGDGPIHRQEELQSQFNVTITDENAETMVLRDCPMCHSSILMRKTILKTLKGYQAKYVTCEDWDFLLRAIQQGYKYRIFPELLVRFRVHPTSKTAEEISSGDFGKYVIKLKLDYVEHLFHKGTFRYIIWGAGNGGKLAKELIDQQLPNLWCVGFVDSFKQGTFLEHPILNPGDLKKGDFDYIFIATLPGRDDATTALSDLGLFPKNDYMWLV